jgi:hypothetical protein
MPTPTTCTTYGGDLNITIPDGVGGYQTFPLPSYAVLNAVGTQLYNNVQSPLLAILNCVWGEVVAKGQGVYEGLATGSGNGSFGSV